MPVREYAFLSPDARIGPEKRPVRLYAHRGGSHAADDTQAEENTIEAFAGAISLGCRRLETDVVATKDDKVLACHGRGGLPKRHSALPKRSKLESMTYDEVKEVYPHIPLLDEVFDLGDDIMVNIDPKTKRGAHFLPGVIKDRGAEGRVCIGAFSKARIDAVVDELRGGRDRVCTALSTMACLGLNQGVRIDHSLETGAAVFQLPDRLAARDTIWRAHARGIPVDIWTINDKPSMEDALRRGADGIMTDDMPMLLEVVEAYGRAA